MARSIKIKWATSHYRFGVDDGVRVRFDVVCATNMPTKVFAYRMLPKSPNGGSEGWFSHICSPVDLEEYPEDGPVANWSPEWFRLSYVDVLVRSVQEAADFIQIVREDVRRIVNTLKTMDSIFNEGTEVMGDEDCDPVVESSSSSAGSLDGSASYGSLSALSAVGTSELSVGTGVSWSTIGTGAGSPIGSSDSLALNRSRVELCAGEASKLLLVQGFDFSDLPDDAVIEGVESRVVLRDATTEPPSSSSLSSAGSDSSLSSLPAQCPRLSFLALQHPSLGLGTNRGDFACIGGPAWETLTHGGSGDLWGFSSLRGRDLKDGSFGLGLVVSNTFQTMMSAAEVDGVELTVYFREEL